MRKRNQIRRCLCPCNKELPSRYKGRERIFFSPECRDAWGILSNQSKIDRLVECWDFLNPTEKLKRLLEVNMHEHEIDELVEKRKN